MNNINNESSIECLTLKGVRYYKKRIIKFILNCENSISQIKQKSFLTKKDKVKLISLRRKVFLNYFNLKLILNHNIKDNNLFYYLNKFNTSVLIGDVRSNKIDLIPPMELMERRIKTISLSNIKNVEYDLLHNNKNLVIVFNENKEVIEMLNIKYFFNNFRIHYKIRTNLIRFVISRSIKLLSLKFNSSVKKAYGF